MKIIASKEAPLITLYKEPSIENLSARLIERTLITSEGTEFIQKDSVYITSPNVLIVTDYQLLPSIYKNYTKKQISFKTSDPSKGVIDKNGYFSFLDEGETTVTVSIGSTSKSINIITTKREKQLTTFSKFLEESLAHYIKQSFFDRFVNSSANFTPQIFSTQNHSTQTYIRNPNLWLSGVDLSPISPWNSSGGRHRAGTLISPRHIIFAAHYQISNGASIRFVTMDGQLVTRTMVSKRTHPNYSPLGSSDICIGLLNEDVPSSVKFAKVLPKNFTTKLPNISFFSSLPAIYTDAEEKLLISKAFSLSGMANFTPPSRQEIIPFFENLIAGDSGNPAFFIINNELILLTVFTFGGAGMGTFVTSEYDAINSMMSELGGTYQLTEIDLSDFPSY